MLESKFALNNLNFKCYIQFFFVRARIGPKKWGGQFDPPLVNRVLANTLVKEGLKGGAQDLKLKIYHIIILKCFYMIILVYKL